jgi:Predicted Zn-dependent peptidases
MKRFEYLVAIIAIISCSISIQAQEKNIQLALDPTVKTGRLNNGLTYYIRHNTQPKNMAYFYIAQKVGAIQEESQQRGLAHFLEHMCFNGTKHFPGDALKMYLERIGVKFGADLNAYTAVDETVYNIDRVPVNVQGAIDSCLYILHDWSNGLTLDSVEIDKERGVIHEEWRMRNSANQRMGEAMMPVILAGSKYADCMPIGSMDVVMNFKPKVLRDYYEKWYYPGLQGIVVVGDINIDEIEAKIKQIFADIPAQPNGAKRVYYPVPDNDKPIVFIGQDKEITSPFATFYFKHDAAPRQDKNTVDYLVNVFLDREISNMFHARLSEIAQQAGTPFGFGNGKNGSFYVAGTKEAFNAYVNCKDKEGDIEKGVWAFLLELNRVRQYGFTESEFNRERMEFLTQLDNIYKEKDKRESTSFVDQYIRLFLDNVAAPGIDKEYALYMDIVPRLTIADINKRFNSYFSKDDHNLVITLTAPQNDTLKVPTKEQLLSLYYKSKAEKLLPYKDNVSTLSLLPEAPKKGKILSTTTDKDGLIRMELSNGAKVVIKKTDFKNDIKMTAMGRGGFSLVPENRYKYADIINMSVAVGGLGNYNEVQLIKSLAGINAEVSSGIADNYQSISGSCTPQFLCNMLELTYASFLYPHKDPSAFKACMDRYKNGLNTSKMQPDRIYNDAVNFALYGKSPYTDNITNEDINNINYDEILKLYKDRFKDASNFTFFFIGNVDVNTLKPYLEKYIASLPSTYKEEQPKPVKMLRRGVYSCNFEQEQQTPKATISMVYSGKIEYNLKNYLLSNILGQVLNLVYTRTIREDAGAAYSVGVGGGAHIYPEKYAMLQIKFPTDPSKKDLAMSLVKKGLEDIANKGPLKGDLDKVKEYLLKTNTSNQTVNAYWVYVMQQKWFSGLDLSVGYDETVKNITTEDVQSFAENILKQGNSIQVSMSSPAK